MKILYFAAGSKILNNYQMIGDTTGNALMNYQAM